MSSQSEGPQIGGGADGVVVMSVEWHELFDEVVFSTKTVEPPM